MSESRLMMEYVRTLRIVGWVTVLVVPAMVLVTSAMTATLDPTRCPVGLVCGN